MTSQVWLSAAEVAEILGCCKRKGYQVIRDLNAELKEKGYFTVAGKISRKYFAERYNIEL